MHRLDQGCVPARTQGNGQRKQGAIRPALAQGLLRPRERNVQTRGVDKVGLNLVAKGDLVSRVLLVEAAELEGAEGGWLEWLYGVGL